MTYNVLSGTLSLYTATGLSCYQLPCLRSVCGEEICLGPVKCTAMEYWSGHKDQYPSLSAVALSLVLAPASRATYT